MNTRTACMAAGGALILGTIAALMIGGRAVAPSGGESPSDTTQNVSAELATAIESTNRLRDVLEPFSRQPTDTDKLPDKFFPDVAIYSDKVDSRLVEAEGSEAFYMAFAGSKVCVIYSHQTNEGISGASTCNDTDWVYANAMPLYSGELGGSVVLTPKGCSVEAHDGKTEWSQNGLTLIRGGAPGVAAVLSCPWARPFVIDLPVTGELPEDVHPS